jgi:propionyl-CoA carboxylase beta chain
MEREQYYGDGVITGFGTVNGRLTYVFAQDFTVWRSAIGNACGEDLQDHGYGDEERRADGRLE